MGQAVVELNLGIQDFPELAHAQDPCGTRGDTYFRPEDCPIRETNGSVRAIEPRGCTRSYYYGAQETDY